MLCQAPGMCHNFPQRYTRLQPLPAVQVICNVEVLEHTHAIDLTCLCRVCPCLACAFRHARCVESSLPRRVQPTTLSPTCSLYPALVSRLACDSIGPLDRLGNLQFETTQPLLYRELP